MNATFKVSAHTDTIDICSMEEGQYGVITHPGSACHGMIVRRVLDKVYDCADLTRWWGAWQPVKVRLVQPPFSIDFEQEDGAMKATYKEGSKEIGVSLNEMPDGSYAEIIDYRYKGVILKRSKDRFIDVASTHHWLADNSLRVKVLPKGSVITIEI